MIRLLLGLVFLFIAAWVGVQIQGDPGYVLAVYKHWSVEMPLWLAIVLLVLGFFLLSYLLKLFQYLGSFSSRYQQWRAKRRRNRALTQTSKGFMTFIDGNWEQAEKLLIRSVANSETPLINYLIAARAAQAQGQDEKRDGYLKLANESTKGAELAIGLTQAELQQEHHQLEEALATLETLRKSAPSHKRVLSLLKDVYCQLEDWDGLLKLLDPCRREKVIDDTQYQALQKQAALAFLKNALELDDRIQLKKAWAGVPKNLSRDPDLVAFYADALCALGEGSDAEKLLRETLKSHWHSGLVRQYGNMVGGVSPDKQLTAAEGWLKAHSEDPSLLLTLGRLSFHNKLWGKARSYLEDSLAFHQDPQAYVLLAELCEQLQQPKEALDYYRKAISLTLSDRSISA